ncbi:THUMP domain-containing protein 2-like [Mya arenaria]|uniref:THUMP domain-containing protein 2-like n=1 Tax=Mya arenaria TaxID=6604 RepID=UPI0022E8DDD4|nr:THUMP domain-containing protein 2-like [Mya arenaria]
MKFYSTIGRGTEKFFTEELKELFLENLKLQPTVTEGKTFFTINDPVDQLKKIQKTLLTLKTAERVFVEVTHVPVDKKDKRGLLTLLHSHLGNRDDWRQALDTLAKLEQVRPDVKQDALDSCPQKKRRKVESDGTTFRVSCKLAGKPKCKLDLQRTSMQMAVLISKTVGWKTNLHNPKYEVNIHMNDQYLTVGIPLTDKPLSQRVYIRHCGLRCTVAWIMVRLCGLAGGEVVMDPMCGAATILVEGAMCQKDALFFGMDKSAPQLQLASENVQYAGLGGFVHLIQGEATRTGLGAGTVDAVVTDAPFGQNHAVDGDIQLFYCCMLKEMCRVLKPGGRMVLLTSEALMDTVAELCASQQTCPETHPIQGFSPDPTVLVATHCSFENTSERLDSVFIIPEYKCKTDILSLDSPCDTKLPDQCSSVCKDLHVNDAIEDNVGDNASTHGHKVIKQDDKEEETKSDQTLEQQSILSTTDMCSRQCFHNLTSNTSGNNSSGNDNSKITQKTDECSEVPSGGLNFTLTNRFPVKLGETEGIILVMCKH